MDDDTQLDLYEALMRGWPPRRRRWWEKQRYIIPLAVLVLAPAVYFVAGQALARDGGRQAPEPGARGAAQLSGADGQVAMADTRPAAAGAGGDAAAGEDAAADVGADVCGRVLGLRDELRMQGVDPSAVYREVVAIQQDAAGTPVAAAADEVVRTMEDVVVGRADTDDVVAAGAALIAAC